MWKNLIIKRISFEVYVQNISFVVCRASLLHRCHLTTAPSPAYRHMRGDNVLCEVFCILRPCVHRCTVPCIWLQIRRTWGSCGTTWERRAGAMTFTGGCRETGGGRCAHRTIQTHLTSPDRASGIRRTIKTQQRDKMVTSCSLLVLICIRGINSFWCLIPDSFVNYWVLTWHKCSLLHKCSWNIFDLAMVVKLFIFVPNCDSNLTVNAWISFLVKE